MRGTGRDGNTRIALLIAFLAALAGCESDVPSGIPDGDGDGSGEADADADAEPEAEDGADLSAEADTDASAEADSGSGCEPLADDYMPRENGSADDEWPACVSDDNAYHPIDASISSIARVGQFEQIADLLWRRTGDPSTDDFVNARVIYAQDNGLDSRIQRREDLHFPAVPVGEGACTDAGVPEAHPDRCVGPGRMLPILNDAFSRGGSGDRPRVQVARIEATLLWFLYVSPYKEAHTCTETPRDCDSAWAYYTGGEPRGGGLGFAGAVRALDLEAHDRAWDGLLAVRCWKNLDHETGISTDLATRDRAIVQADRALLRGLAVVLADRLRHLDAATGEDAAADAAFANILGYALDREATARDAGLAAALRAQVSRTEPAAIDVDAAVTALEALFPCP